jgi:hypothetical protein
LLTGYDVSEGKFYAAWRKGKWVVGNLVLKLDKGIYVYQEVYPPTVLSFTFSSRNVLYFYPIQLLLSSSLVPSIPPLCPAQPSLLPLPSLAKPAQPSSCPYPTASSLDSDPAPCPPLQELGSGSGLGKDGDTTEGQGAMEDATFRDSDRGRG